MRMATMLTVESDKPVTGQTRPPLRRRLSELPVGGRATVTTLESV